MICTAVAHPNIALVKYWGKRDPVRNLPAVPSVSLTVAGPGGAVRTRTTVAWAAPTDAVWLGDRPASEPFAQKVRAFLDRVDPHRPRVEVRTENDFPTGAGLASSASGFAALALAAVAAAGQDVSDVDRLGALARMGSGSACRSLFPGLAHWRLGARDDGADSVAAPVPCPAGFDLSLVVAVVSDREKPVTSTAGMEQSRLTSPFWDPWVRLGPVQVESGLRAIASADLEALGAVMEASTLQMHAVMHTTRPAIVYALPSTTACMHEVYALRARGVGAWFTMDAGPNVKVLCRPDDAPVVRAALAAHVPSTLLLGPGPGARLL